MLTPLPNKINAKKAHEHMSRYKFYYNYDYDAIYKRNQNLIVEEKNMENVLSTPSKQHRIFNSEKRKRETIFQLDDVT